MAKKKSRTLSSSLKDKAKNLFSTSPPPSSLTPEEEAEIEREQLESDLAELRLIEEQELAAKASSQSDAAQEVQVGSGGKSEKKKSSKDRFKEREARKQAALEASMAPPTTEEQDAVTQQAKEDEFNSLMATCKILNTELYDITPDGHCLYAAIADQLMMLGILMANENSQVTTRAAAAAYMSQNPDSFMPFLPSVSGEDANGAEDDGMMTMEGYQEYVRRVRESGEWGGEPEIQALSRYYNVPILVIQKGPPTIVCHSTDDSVNGALDPQEAKKLNAVTISYHRSMYGLGEHYNSLRKVRVQQRPVMMGMV